MRHGTRSPPRGSATKRKTGTLNTAHQTATVRKEIRTAWVESAMPNAAGISTMATLTAKRIPPPR